MSSEIELQADERWVRRLFFALALLYVLPFWTVHYLPTVDGPCHTYNAWILRQYGNVEQYPLFQRYYAINIEPFPNWISHGIMALLMFVVPPLVAEKLLVSLYALLFLSGAWYLAGSVKAESRWLAFLAFPFVHNYLFQWGFYNFCMSLALFLFILGFWWRRREKPGLSSAVGMNLLLWLCYFSHILSYVLSLLAIAVLWLATLRRHNWRRYLVHVLVLTPQIFLPLWYFARQGTDTLAASESSRSLLRSLLRLRALFTFGKPQRLFVAVLAGVFLLFLLLTLWRGNLRGPGGGRRPVLRQADAFLLLAAVLTAIYFLSPAGMAGGTMLKPRLSLYPYLVLIPWLSPPFGQRGRRIAIATLAVVALLNAGYLIHWYGRLSGEMQAYLSGLDLVRPNTRLLPLLFPHEKKARVDVLGHAASYEALEKGLVDWDNYEATLWFFPTQFRATAPPPVIAEIEGGRVASLRTRPWKSRADYVYTWQMPPGHPLALRLDRFHDLISVKNGGALWERRRERHP